MRVRIAFACLVTVLAPPLLSQETPRPYAGDEKREIKALSPEEIESYRAGAGMGFAKAAELNHYPGPKHVLELAKGLALDDAQTAKTRAVHDRMHAETIRLGGRLIDQERRLDQLFASAKIDKGSLSRSVREIARFQGEVRLAHLKAHLAMRSLLSPAQVAKYDELRGYGSGAFGSSTPTRGCASGPGDPKR